MTREDRQQKMSDLRNEHKSEIDAVLSPDQQAKRDAQRKNFDERRRGKRGESARLNGGAATSSLGLSDEQSKKMTAADESFRDKLQSIRNEKLTADERKDKVSSARDEHEKNVKSILSDEQFSKWKANMKNRSHKRLKQEHYYRK